MKNLSIIAHCRTCRGQGGVFIRVCVISRCSLHNFRRSGGLNELNDDDDNDDDDDDGDDDDDDDDDE